MKKTSEQIVTQAQLEIIFTSWATCAEIPAKGNKALVVWPNNEHAEITRHKSTGDHKGPLFKIEFFRH
jgi:hypothetical protein